VWPFRTAAFEEKRYMKTVLCALALVPLLLAGCATPPDSQAPAQPIGAEAPPDNPLNERISYYARAYDVPEALIHRSILQESGYNPTRHIGPFWGLMQLRLETARSVGYRGSAHGLLDADTNLKYAVAYLSNAYVVAGGNPDRALALYSSGYYYEARRKGLLDRLRTVQGD
jgi:soluble lytic murein transglycosylase-like protein